MKQRVRLTFRKEGALRFISHHDVMRTFERILRRTGLPLHASAGFNPRPRISFPAALGVGIASEGEVCEFDLDGWVAPDEIRERVAAQMPAGLGLADRLRSANIIPHGGGYTFPHLREVLSVIELGQERYFELSLGVDDSRQIVSDVRDLPYAYRGLEVVERVVELGLGELVARLAPIYVLKI